MSEHDFEPIRGLPGNLPAGEHILWQGAPSWTRLACQAFHVRAVASYFGVMLAWRTATAIGGGEAPLHAVRSALMVTPIAGVGIAMLCLLAWLNSRTTVYTITNRRVVLRFGVAVTKAINIPFTVIDSGSIRANPDGSGDVALTLKEPNKIAFLQLWPHARPWRMSSPQPSLRALADARTASSILVSAMSSQTSIDVASAGVTAIDLGQPQGAVHKGRVSRPFGRPEASAA